MQQDQEGSMFQTAELPELSESEYLAIFAIKEDYPNASFRDLHNRIISAVPRLESFNYHMIGMMYFRKRSIYWTTAPDIFQFFRHASTQINLLSLALNPTKFLFANRYPFFQSRRGIDWTMEEDNLLFTIMENANSELNFAFLALCFPGRTGRQIHNHFLDKLKEGTINDPRQLKASKHILDPICKRYFLPSTERALKADIVVMTTQGIHVIEDLVIEKAKDYYKTPWILSERATYQEFASKGICIYVPGTTIYSEEFLKLSNEIYDSFDIDNAIDEDAEDDHKEQQVQDIIMKFNLPPIVFTHKWFRKFLKRNRLSLRNAHYIRRGAIDQKYVKKYIYKLAKYVVEHGWNCVYNMDETACRINKGSTRAVAPIGLECIEVNAKRNSKECFTVVATCTRYKKFPLIILKKAMKEKVKQVTSKIRGAGKTLIWATFNKQGWMNETVMLRYLEHLHQLNKHEPCALVLDVYPAHRTPNVKEVAKTLDITLIYVPANGKGLYQPLDRRLFGIIKSKLRSLAKSKIFSGKD